MGARASPEPQLSEQEKLDLARRTFREMFARCFWFWDPETTITTSHLPGVIRGLREHGGHEGYRIAARLWR